VVDLLVNIARLPVFFFGKRFLVIVDVLPIWGSDVDCHFSGTLERILLIGVDGAILIYYCGCAAVKGEAGRGPGPRIRDLKQSVLIGVTPLESWRRLGLSTLAATSVANTLASPQLLT